MATKNQQPEEAVELQSTGQDAPRYSLNELRERQKISPGILCGVCAQEGWRPGKMLTESVFTVAVERFMKGGGGNAARR